MKDPRFIISTILILALAAFGFSERQKIGELNRQIAQLQEEAAAQAAKGKEDTSKLQQQIDDRKAVITQMEEQRKNVAANGPATPEEEAAKPKPATPDFGEMMKKMFTDPESKKAMRGMQLMGVRMMYGDLAKELGLLPDQANQVMELLGDRQMALTTKGIKMLSGDSGEGASADEVGKDVQATKDEFDQQLEGVLGKDGMAKLGEYEKSLGDRMQMQQYKQAFTASGLPLDDNESKGLLTLMREEREKQPPSPLEPGAKDVGAALQAIQSEETVNKLMADREAMDQRVLIKARNVLAPDKMAQFENIQKQTTGMLKMQFQMAKPLFAPKK